MAEIVSLTLNPAVDKSCCVDHVMPEHKLRCSQPSFQPGGGGINVARAIVKLGGHAIAFWTCGGAIGELLRQRLDEESLLHFPLPIQEMTRENLIVFEEASGQQFRFGMPGAALSEAEIQSCIDALCTLDPVPRYVVLSGSLPAGVDDGLYARIIESLPAGSRIVLDTSGAPLRLGVKHSVFMIKPNKRELGHLAGKAIENDSQIREVARQLIDTGRVDVILTSLGSGGAILTTKDVHEHIRTPTVEIRSKVGAGDSMVAGLVLGLTRGLSMIDAAKFGVAAGAAAVMTDGTELCRREDTERLFEAMKSMG